MSRLKSEAGFPLAGRADFHLSPPGPKPYTARMPSAVTSSRASVSSFVRGRFASFLAVAPLGVWTFAHVWHNLAAFQGPAAWQSAVTEDTHPVAQLTTLLLVLLPLGLHAAWGVVRLASSRPNNLRYGFYANMKYALQRASAIGVLLFLGAHLWLALLRPRLVEGRPEPFADIAHEMRFHTPTLVVYILGTLGVAFHLANGLQSFAMGWGLVASRKAIRRLEWVAAFTFAVLLAMSWGAIYALYVAAA
jgi:succinate dehydrogenase / fumarate reductase, cytochrome b subunit